MLPQNSQLAIAECAAELLHKAKLTCCFSTQLTCCFWHVRCFSTKQTCCFSISK